MSGRIIHTPAREHSCAPGWTYGPLTERGRVMNPPWSADFPKGVIWLCECGQTWVSAGCRNVGGGMAHFRREGRWARRRRIKRGAS